MKHVLIDKYISYAKKWDICKRIVDASSYTTINGKKVFDLNSISRHMLFTLNMINEYTDIYVDFKNVVSCFDTLNKERLIDLFIGTGCNDGILPQDELNEFFMIMDMTLSDMLENERSFAGCIENKLNAIASLFDSFVKQIENESLKENNNIKMK